MNLDLRSGDGGAMGPSKAQPKAAASGKPCLTPPQAPSPSTCLLVEGAGRGCPSVSPGLWPRGPGMGPSHGSSSTVLSV